MGEEGCLDVDGVLAGLHSWAWFVEEVSGRGTGEDVPWPVLVKNGENRNIVCQRVDVDHLIETIFEFEIKGR